MLARRLLHECDEALIALVAAGDELALGELYDRFGRVAYGLALRVCREPSLAEEAVQDAFLSVWRSAEHFDSSRGLGRTWLLTIVHRRAVDLVQHAVRRRRVAPDETPDQATASAEDTAAVREQQRAVRDALELISGPQREALELAYYGGLSQTQIAGRLSVPLGMIKTRIMYGLRKLSVLLCDPTRGALSSQAAPNRPFAADAPEMERAGFH